MIGVVPKTNKLNVSYFLLSVNHKKIGHVGHQNNPRIEQHIHTFRFISIDHQHVQVPKMEVLIYISCIDTAYIYVM